MRWLQFCYFGVGGFRSKSWSFIRISDDDVSESATLGRCPWSVQPRTGASLSPEILRLGSPIFDGAASQNCKKKENYEGKHKQINYAVINIYKYSQIHDLKETIKVKQAKLVKWLCNYVKHSARIGWN